MNKIKSWALMLVAILTTGFALSSCTKDQMQAADLNGQWRGDFGMYYIDQYNYRWNASYSIINFYQTGFTDHGTGRQYDYYSQGPYSYQYYYFEWSINNGVVRFHYPSDSKLDTEIYDYEMTNCYFSGYFSTTHSHFYLDKYSDNFAWDNYSGNYGYYYRSGYTWDGHYYDTIYYTNAKTRAANSDSSNEETPFVKTGNRFNEN